MTTSLPRAIGAVAVAGRVCTAPSYVSKTVPWPRSPMLTTTRARRPTRSRRDVGSRPSACRSAAKIANATPAPNAPKAKATAIRPIGPSPNATAPNRPPMPNIARKPRSTGRPVASSVRVARRNGMRTCGRWTGMRRRTRIPPPMLERRRSAVPSTAEPVKTSSRASALIGSPAFRKSFFRLRSYCASSG